jgi:hypothetical protein
MAIEAELADGRILEFPDGTDPAVIQSTVKRVMGITDAPAAKAAPVQNPTLTPELAGLMGATVPKKKSVLEGQASKPTEKQLHKLRNTETLGSGAVSVASRNHR